MPAGIDCRRTPGRLQIEQLRAAEVAGPHGGCWNSRMFDERVVDQFQCSSAENSSGGWCPWESRNLQRSAECCPERILSKLRLRGGHRGVELIGRRVERRTTECIGCRPLIRTLAARGAAAEKKAARPATPAAAAELTRWLAAVRAWRRACRRAEALRKLSGRRIRPPARWPARDR
jgi:hypothetical protein